MQQKENTLTRRNEWGSDRFSVVAISINSHTIMLQLFQFFFYRCFQSHTHRYRDAMKKKRERKRNKESREWNASWSLARAVIKWFWILSKFIGNTRWWWWWWCSIIISYYEYATSKSRFRNVCRWRIAYGK